MQRRKLKAILTKFLLFFFRFLLTLWTNKVSFIFPDLISHSHIRPHLNMIKFTCVLMLVSLLHIFEDNHVNADCCPNIHGEVCEDDLPVSPWQCCGEGPCNIFCCNCDGGCRNGAIAAKSLLETYDSDRDGHFNLDEARSYVLNVICVGESKLVDLEKEFLALDKNGDEELSFDEIDGK